MRIDSAIRRLKDVARRGLAPVAAFLVCLLAAGVSANAFGERRGWLGWLLGVDRDLSSGELRVAWPSAPVGDAALFTLLGVGAVAVVVLLAYRLDTSRTQPWAKVILPMLRLAVLALGLAMLLRPVLVFTERLEEPSHVVLATDISESMTTPDAWRDAATASAVASRLDLESDAAVRQSTRYELARRAAQRLREPLAAGGDRIVHVHPFGDALASEVDELPEDLSAPTATTSLDRTLSQVAAQYEGRQLAGVVLLTDGVSTGQSSIESAAPGGPPIFAVPIGTIEGPQNLRVAEVDVSPYVFVDDAAEVTARIVHRGMDDERVRVQFEKRVGGGTWTPLSEADELLAPGSDTVTVRATFSESRPGPVEFRVLASTEGRELTADDNVGFAETQVVREQLRVLLIAGSTFPEIQFLRNAYYRDRTVELSSWLQSASPKYRHPGNRPIRRLPSNAEEINEYDCVILYDPDPSAWPANFPDLLSQFVTQAGGGLVLIAGELLTHRLFDEQDDPALAWLNLMPVIRERGLFRSAVQMRLSARTPFTLSITPAGKSSEVLRFAEEAEKNREILDDLPGLFWHFPVTRAKPGAEVLAVHGDPRMRNEYGQEILIAEQRVGPGRTMFLGFDSTYRWRYRNEEAFNGFWRRVAGRAGRAKRLGGGYPFKLSTDRSEFQPGSEVRVVARFLSPDSPEAAVEQLSGEVQRGADEAEPLSLEPTGQPGEYAGTFTPEREGTHLARIWLGTPSPATKAATLPITVREAGRELDEPTIDLDRLSRLAEASGGAVVSLAELEALPDFLKIGRVVRSTESREELWDAPLVWVSLFLLVCLGWFLRKRARLI